MAERAEIADEIDSLSVHCRPPLMTTEARALWTRDWCDDLGGFPIEHIRLAFRQWRQSGKTKFPTPGELLPIIRAQGHAEQREPAEKPWRPLNDAEYERLTLGEKVRHHRIVAHEARRKAGPMWSNGKPLAAEDMPPRWREWSARAENHEAEAARLAQFMRRRPEAVAAE